MNRRTLFEMGLAAAGGAIGAVLPSRAVANANAGTPAAVYHLSDIEKPMFVLANLRNHFAGMGGPLKVRLALVVHGPPLMSFRRASNNEALKEAVATLNSDGLELYACSHTMRSLEVSLDQLLPGFVAAEKGGVVKLAELQGQGWAYLRP